MYIGLAGPAGCGKDAAANILAIQGFAHFVPVSFAEPIKTYLPKILGLPDYLFTDRYYKENTISSLGKSPREIMQSFGTDWGRNMVHPDVWVISALKRAAELQKRSPRCHILFTDVRFESEAKAIHERGGFVVHILRPDNPYQTKHQNHASESGVKLRETDGVIRNDGSLHDFKKQVVEYMQARIAAKNCE